MSFHFVYTITNRSSRKVYVGRTSDYIRRWSQHCSKSRPAVSYIHDAIQKHGKEQFCFEVIATCHKDDVNALEEYYIGWYKSLAPTGYNLTTTKRDCEATRQRKKNAAVTRKVTRVYERTNPHSRGLPPNLFALYVQGEPKGYMVKITGQRQWSIVSSRFTMEEKLERALVRREEMLAGRASKSRKVHVSKESDGLPTYVSFNSKKMMFAVRKDRTKYPRFFSERQDAIAFLNSL